VFEGQFAEGVSEIQKARELESDFSDPIGGLAYAYARAGKTQEARKLLSELQRRSNQTYVIPQEIAVVYAALGDHDQAIVWLQEEFEVCGVGCTALKVSVQVDSLRSDPRFIALLQSLKFPP
jgi:pentatricopeptide repeat protein